jgi:hypothetical protein
MSEFSIERMPPPERSFELGGRRWQCRRGKIPMALLFNVGDLLGQATGITSDAPDAVERGFALMRGLRDFLTQMVTKDQREEFLAFLNTAPEEDDAPETYDWQDLQRITTELVEQVTNAPFEQPSGSPSSPPANGASSAASSDSEASTSVPTRRMKL